ncbi:MAG: MATE family efflux transporter [Anaerolineae bacterium]
MQDLTRGPVLGHIARLSLPIAIGMLLQNLYHLIDLYFVGRLGETAIAGVSVAGNVQFMVLAGTQVLGVGAMALIANAVGRGDIDDARLLFNQSLSMAALFALITLVFGYLVADAYLGAMTDDAAAQEAGRAYLYAFLPGLALQFALVSMGSALRGSGVARPAMLVQLFTVVLNAALAPVMIAGWGTGIALGTAGAGLASTVSIACGTLLMAVYFLRRDSGLGFDVAALRPRLPVWRRMLAIGLPPGGEFALMAIFLMVIFWVLADFGAAAQAGYGVGQRVIQTLFLPVMAIAFGTVPVAAQNMGANQHARIRETFLRGLQLTTGLMALLTVVCLAWPHALVRPFSDDPEVIAAAAGFLGIICWNFVPSGVIFLVSGMFQALGNTRPALASSASRLFLFALPALLLAGHSSFGIPQLWWLSVTSVFVQAIISLLLLWREAARHGMLLGTTRFALN